MSNWIEEAREAVKDMGLDTDEMSDAVVVRLGPVRLWLTSSRISFIECLHPCVIMRRTLETIGTVEAKLAAKGWMR